MISYNLYILNEIYYMLNLNYLNQTVGMSLWIHLLVYPGRTSMLSRKYHKVSLRGYFIIPFLIYQINIEFKNLKCIYKYLGHGIWIIQQLRNNTFILCVPFNSTNKLIQQHNKTPPQIKSIITINILNTNKKSKNKLNLVIV